MFVDLRNQKDQLVLDSTQNQRTLKGIEDKILGVLASVLKWGEYRPSFVSLKIRHNDDAPLPCLGATIYIATMI